MSRHHEHQLIRNDENALLKEVVVFAILSAAKNLTVRRGYSSLRSEWQEIRYFRSRNPQGSADYMYPLDSKARSSITILVIFIAFVWIGYAYIVGPKSSNMLLHPIVPILLIALLFGFRGDDSVRRVMTIAILLISIWMFARLRGVFMPFVIGFALAYIANVALSGLENIPIPLPKGRRVRLPKAAAVAMLIVLLLGAITFFALGIVPQLIEQAAAMKEGIASFYSRTKDYTMKMLADLQEGRYPFKNRLPASWQTAIDNNIDDNIDKISEYVQQKIPSAAKSASELFGRMLKSLSSGLRGTMGHVFSAFFVLIVFIYALQSFQSHMEKLRDIFPETQRRHIVRYAAEIDVNMRSFLKGQLAVIVAISIISIIAYSIIRVPFALLVGLLAGLCNAIPTIGPIIGGAMAILASIVGFVAGNYGSTWFLIRLVLVIGVAFGIQLLDNSLISPKIMSRSVEVHPLVVIFAVLLSASLVGPWGAILAIPGVVVFKAIIKVSGEIRAEQEAREMGL